MFGHYSGVRGTIRGIETNFDIAISHSLAKFVFNAIKSS